MVPGTYFPEIVAREAVTMKARMPVKARKLSLWLRLAVMAEMIFSIGAVGCRSTASPGGKDRFCEPLGAWRDVRVSPRKTAADWARQV